jgi:hypothetical protein
MNISESHKILIIDNNEITNSYLMNLLSSDFGYQLFFKRNSSHLDYTISQTKPDVIIISDTLFEILFSKRMLDDLLEQKNIPCIIRGSYLSRKIIAIAYNNHQVTFLKENLEDHFLLEAINKVCA